MSRLTRHAAPAQLLALAVVMAVAVLTAGTATWDLELLGLLALFSVVSDVAALGTRAHIKLSGSFLALVLAMVLLGGLPAALIGALTISVGWLRWREKGHFFLNNLLTYVTFPLVGGLVFHAIRTSAGLEPSEGLFYVLVFGVFVQSLAINFLMIAGYSRYIDGGTLTAQIRSLLLPLLPTELVAACLAAGVAYLYDKLGLQAIALFALLLLYFQYLLGRLLTSQERADELELRTTQLASFQVGLLSVLVRTLDLRDRMTARHSAAVARYSREIAQAAGLPERDQELVHTAALLHDIGKFAFPDRILSGSAPLSDADWPVIRTHPEEGAKIVSDMDGYGPASEIIHAHHERMDGHGYPRGLKADEIPELSRIIAVADTYDVITARDSYRTPVSSFEAIQELRRVAGRQLDGRYVEIFIEVLAGKDVRYRHGEDADFDAELALQRRVHDYASPSESSSQF